MAKTPAAMVVDQDVQARYDIKQALRSTGLTLAGEAGFGIEAVTAATEARPDVILVGVGEPVERPIQTVESLLSLLPDTPIIVYSQSRDIETARKAMLAGARDYLPRPVKPDVLRDSIFKAMEAEENRRLRQKGVLPSAPTAGTVITVFGAKGGIGKSTVSTNLAAALAQQSAGSVVIVDLDNGFGDITGMLDIRPERTLLDLVRDIDKVQPDDLSRYLATHEFTGLNVLAGPSVLEWRQIGIDQVRRVVDLLARHYDTVVVDTGGILNEVSELALELATIVLWITTTEFASVSDTIHAMRALKQLSYSQERVRIVMNALSPDDGVRPGAVQEALQQEIFWQIPYDKKVRQGTHLGQPIILTAPNSMAAKSLVDLAGVIAGGGNAKSSPKKSAGLKWRPGVQPVPAEGS